MNLARFEHGAVVAQTTETAAQAARRMRDFHVGCVVVIDGARPVGILTDRDLVMRVVAQDRDPRMTLVSEIVTRDLTTLHRDSGVAAAVRLMRERGVRRLPIVTDEGKVTGMVTADDLTVLLSEQLSCLGTGIRDNVDADQTR